MFAFVHAYRHGLFHPKYWLPNLSAGLVVGIVALPLAMAFAIASGAKPEQGLITAIVAAAVVGLLGGSPVQIAGPTGAFIVILAGITAQYGFIGLQIATFMAGCLLIVMGLLKAGHVIKFIPESVIVGFTAGIGVIIFFNEWKDFFGLPIHVPLDAYFYTKLTSVFTSLPHLNLSTTLLGLASLTVIIISPQMIPFIPSPLVAMVFATSLEAVFRFNGVATIGSVFGGLPKQLPHFQALPLSLAAMMPLLLPALTIALLGAIESLLSATAADRLAKTKHHANHELIGQGIANLLCPLFGGFAATGAIARTATNVRHGGNSPIAAIVHSLFLIAVIVYLSPLAQFVPLCSLAAILMVVAYNMSDIPHFSNILMRSTLSEVAVLITTFLLTIFSNLVIGVAVGVSLSLLLRKSALEASE